MSNAPQDELVCLPKEGDPNYDLSNFREEDLTESKPKARTHRIPMGIFATAGTYWLLIRHDRRLVNFVSDDPNETKPNPARVSAGAYYITIESGGVVLNKLRNRLERINIYVWSRSEQHCMIGSDTVATALKKYLRKMEISPVMVDSSNGLKYQTVRGHFLTFIKEHEVI